MMIDYRNSMSILTYDNSNSIINQAKFSSFDFSSIYNKNDEKNIYCIF